MPKPEKTIIWNDDSQSMLHTAGQFEKHFPEVAQVLEGDPLASVRQLAATLG
jgi:hypothetical protein